ncbi:MAG: Crp/Fnr family transcriptional regulator [Actinomycetota bacterium]
MAGGFLGELTSDEARALRDRSRPRRYPKGSTLFNEGESSDRVFVVTEGQAKLSFFTDDGREILLAVRGPGEIIGEMSAIDGEPRSATATAMESVEALVMTSDGFESFITDNPRVGLLLLQMLSRRLRDADRKRIEFGAFDTIGRVARRLVELADDYGEATDDGVRISLPLTQQDLAGWTGSSREAVSKALQTLRGRGWIATHRKGITVLDLEAVRRRAG